MIGKKGFSAALELAAAEKSGNFALVLIDLENFKYINGTYGHPEGDAFLENMATVLQHVVRDEDCISFRQGGDEFAILLSGVTTDEKVIAAAKRIQAELDDYGIEASIAGRLHKAGETVEELVSDIDGQAREDRELRKNSKYNTEEHRTGIAQMGSIAATLSIADRDVPTLLTMWREGRLGNN